MNKVNENLYIIFGTTRGLGRALYEYASATAQNNFLLVNRKPLKSPNRDICQTLTLDLSKPLRDHTQ